MIAKANAMNSTTFARGRTAAGKDGTAAVRRCEILARLVVRAQWWPTDAGCRRHHLLGAGQD